MADGAIGHYLARRRRTRRIRIAFALGAVLLALRATFDFAFDSLTARIVSRLDAVTGDSVTLMAIAGWLTIALVPVAAAFYQSGRLRRADRRQPVLSTTASTDDTGEIRLTTRVRSQVGHGIAPHPVTFWLRRVPLLLVTMTAVLFWPLTGSAMANRWMTTQGGIAFAYGWRLALAAAAIGIIATLAEPWLSAHTGTDRARVRRGVRLASVALPLTALTASLLLA